MELKDLMVKLNESQREAVESIEGPVMVMAGPGTGKTQVLAMRIAYILENTDTPPEAILALTFSNAGKQSMRERLVSLIGTTGYMVQIETFHGFAEHVIRTNPMYFAIADDRYQLVDDLDKYIILDEILSNGPYRKLKPIKSPRYYVKHLKSAISDLKKEGFGPSEYRQKIDSLEMKDDEREKQIEIAMVYGEYEQELKKMMRYDYDDLINLVVSEFEENAELLASFEEKYLYLLADEYQDTNTSQNKILFSLAKYWGQMANLFVVGDPDQSIYRFQGASLENMLEFRNRFPNSKIVYLGNNYRSHQTLLDGASSVITNNIVRGAKLVANEWSLKSPDQTHGEKIQVVELANAGAEDGYVVGEIMKLKESNVSLEEIAVVFRNNAHGAGVAWLLAASGVAYQYSSRDLLDNLTVKNFLKLLNGISKINQGYDDVELYQCLALPWWGGDALTLIKANREAQGNRAPLFEEIMKHKELAKIVTFLSTWNLRSEQVPLGMFLAEVIDQSGMIPWILNQKTAMEDVEGMRSLLDFVDKQVKKKPDLKIGELLKIFEMYGEFNLPLPPIDLASAKEGVSLITAHGAKGLEFEYVFIIHAIDRVWGNKQDNSGIKLPQELLSNPLPKTERYEDERRLFYVSMTRAKKKLIITRAKEYDDKPTTRSVFVNEINPEVMELVDLDEYEKETNKTQFHQLWLTPDQRPAVDEQKYLRQIIENEFVLSYSAIKDYLACPHLFKVNHLLRIPKPTDEAALYGTIMHRLMEDYLKRGKTMNRDKVITELVDRHLSRHPDKERWIETLKENFQVVVDKYLIGVAKPESSEILIGKHQPVLFEGVRIQGKIDRIDWVDKIARTVRVVDYKTTAAKSKNALLGLTADKESPTYVDQLRFYALLLRSANYLRYKPVEMSLVFLTPTKTKNPDIKHITLDVEDDENMENLKQSIHDVWDKIQNLEFEHNENCECEK